MTFLSRRKLYLFGVLGLLGAGAVAVACSPTNQFPDGGGPDSGGGDTTTDGPSNNDGGGKDATGDGAIPPCTTTNVMGPCDIVKQNCPSGQECNAVGDGGGVYASQCVPNTTGSIKEGYACTTQATNPCVAGLECIDNGSGGRCSRRCCLGDDSLCGTSHPEGYAGHCNLGIDLQNYSNNPGYAVCTYSASCEPFHIQTCGTNQVCLVLDVNGTANCTVLFGSGLNEKAACVHGNDCNEGLGCYGQLDGGAAKTCQYNCYNPPGPFDAGVKNLGAGYGGCPTGEMCKLINWGGSAPAWLGICN